MFKKHKYILSALFAILLVNCSTHKVSEQKTMEIYKSPDDRATLEVIEENSAYKQNAGASAKVALLVPLSGKDIKVGKNIFDATQQAVFDLKFSNLHIIPIDTTNSTDAIIAHLQAQRPDIIIGPVFARDVNRLYPYARKNGLCMIAFSNDQSLAGQDCLMLLGIMPSTNVNRVIDHARAHNFVDIRALLPKNRYGETIEQSLSGVKTQFYQADGDILTKSEITSSVASPSVNTALLIPEGGTNLANIAAELGDNSKMVKLLGSGLWEEDKTFKNPAFNGAWYASLPGKNREVFERKFAKSFGYKPLKIATLGYDAVALLSALTSQTTPNKFNKNALLDPAGFIGVAGAFRFRNDGSNERLLSVYEITEGKAIEISPAADHF